MIVGKKKPRNKYVAFKIKLSVPNKSPRVQIWALNRGQRIFLLLGISGMQPTRGVFDKH